VEEIVTGDAVVLDLPCARFPTRMLARLIDMAVQVPLLITVVLLAVALSTGRDSAWGASLLAGGAVLVIVGYPLIFETLSRGRTLGKLALGLRVVGDDGSPERFRQALVRALAGAVECWALLGVPALIASLFSARGRRLGDIFAGTFALRERAPRPAAAAFPASAFPADPAPPFLVDPAPPSPADPAAAAPFPAPGGIVPPVTPVLTAWAASLDLSALPDYLAAAAASYLTRYGEFHDRPRQQLGSRLAADIAARVSPPPPPGLPPVYYLGVVLAEHRRRAYARFLASSPPPDAPLVLPVAPAPAPAPSAAAPATAAPAPAPSAAGSLFPPPQ
jgi:uncharacterized RDD family membrane protein YckC